MTCRERNTRQELNGMRSRGEMVFFRAGSVGTKRSLAVRQQTDAAVPSRATLPLVTNDES